MNELDQVREHIEEVRDEISYAQFNEVGEGQLRIAVREGGGKLKKEPSTHGELIGEIPAGTYLVDDYKNDYWHLITADKEGWVSGLWLDVTENHRAFANQIKKRRNAEADQVQKKINTRRRWVKAFTANVRSQGSTSAKVVASLVEGEVVVLQEREGEWVKVHYPSTSNADHPTSYNLDRFYETGWMHESLLSTSRVNKMGFDERYATEERRRKAQARAKAEARR